MMIIYPHSIVNKPSIGLLSLAIIFVECGNTMKSTISRGLLGVACHCLSLPNNNGFGVVGCKPCVLSAIMVSEIG